MSNPNDILGMFQEAYIGNSQRKVVKHAKKKNKNEYTIQVKTFINDCSVNDFLKSLKDNNSLLDIKFSIDDGRTSILVIYKDFDNEL